MSGGTVTSPLWLDPRIGAILHTFYPGEMGGDAIVETLLGINNPAGKLPATVYFNNFTARDMRDMDLAHDGGVTHMYGAILVLCCIYMCVCLSVCVCVCVCLFACLQLLVCSLACLFVCFFVLQLHPWTGLFSRV